MNPKIVFFFLLYMACLVLFTMEKPPPPTQPTYPPIQSATFWCSKGVWLFILSTNNFPMSPQISSNLTPHSLPLLQPSKQRILKQFVVRRNADFGHKNCFHNYNYPNSTSLNSWDDKRNTISFSSFWNITMHQHKKIDIRLAIVNNKCFFCKRNIVIFRKNCNNLCECLVCGVVSNSSSRYKSIN